MKVINYHETDSGDDIQLLDGKKSCYGSFCYEYGTATLDLLRKNLKLSATLCIFASQGAEFVGFVSCDSDWWEADSFFLRELFVDQKFQSQGVGSTLMQKCIDHAKKQGAKTLVTQTAYENIPMQRLCASFNFTQWHNPRWKEGITYKLSL